MGYFIQEIEVDVMRLVRKEVSEVFSHTYEIVYFEYI